MFILSKYDTLNLLYQIWIFTVIEKHDDPIRLFQDWLDEAKEYFKPDNDSGAIVVYKVSK